MNWSSACHTPLQATRVVSDTCSQSFRGLEGVKQKAIGKRSPHALKYREGHWRLIYQATQQFRPSAGRPTGTMAMPPSMLDRRIHARTGDLRPSP